MSGGGKTGGKGGGSAKIGSTKAGSARVPGKQAPKSAAGGGGSRDLRVKVKKAGKLKHSSQLWLERQLNDPYVKRARELGYRSRAAFKLEEMDDRFRFLKPGQKLIDLGCAPAAGARSPRRASASTRARAASSASTCCRSIPSPASN